MFVITSDKINVTWDFFTRLGALIKFFMLKLAFFEFFYFLVSS